MQYLFPLEEKLAVSADTVKTQLQILGPLTSAEWWSIGILSATVLGWFGKPLHGIDEAYGLLDRATNLLSTVDKSWSKKFFAEL